MASFYIVNTTNSNGKWLNTSDSHVLQKSITTVICDEYNNYYQIILDKGYRCDGLSVPKIFRWYLPSWDKDNSVYNLAGAIHDALYTVKGAHLFTREECDDVFRGLLRDASIVFPKTDNDSYGSRSFGTVLRVKNESYSPVTVYPAVRTDWYGSFPAGSRFTIEEDSIKTRSYPL